MTPDWMAHAACRGADTHLFFPGTNDSAAPALAFCHRCNVRADCLEDALTRPGCDCGIRGGMSERERRREARKRRVRTAA